MAVVVIPPYRVEVTHYAGNTRLCVTSATDPAFHLELWFTPDQVAEFLQAYAQSFLTRPGRESED